MPLSQSSFKILVPRGNRGIGSQQGSKLHVPNPRLVVENNQVEVVSPPAAGVPHEPASVGQSCVELGGGVVAVRT